MSEEAVEAPAAEAPAAEKPQPRRLEPQEVVEKLNRIPAFCVIDGKGAPMAQVDESVGEESFVLWHTDADLARKALEDATVENPSLKSMPLGLVVAVFAGWADMGIPHEVRISATGAALEVFEKVKPGALQEVRDQGGWSLPLFYDRRLLRPDEQGKPCLALFLNPEHTDRAWGEAQPGMLHGYRISAAPTACTRRRTTS